MKNLQNFTAASAVVTAIALSIIAPRASQAQSGLDSVGWTPQDAAALDFDRDGYHDLAIALAFSDSVAFMVQEPNATGSTFITTQVLEVGLVDGPLSDLPRRLVAADFTGDGLKDVLVLSSGNPDYGTRGSLSLLQAIGTGGEFELTQTQVAEPTLGLLRYPTSMAVGDINQDGVLDVVLGNYNRNSVSIFHGEAGGLFEYQGEIVLFGGSTVSDVDLDDLNNDGLLDLVVLSQTGLFVANGQENEVFDVFQRVPHSTGGKSLTIADIDRDGTLDAVVGDQFGFVHIHHNLAISNSGNPSGSHTTEVFVQHGAWISDLKVLDWDRDGVMDIIAIDNDGASVHVLPYGNPYGNQSHTTGLSPRRLVTGDFNADGAPDLLTINEGDESNFSNPDTTFLAGIDNASIPSIVVENSINLADVYPGGLSSLSNGSADKSGGYHALDRVAGAIRSFAPNGAPTDSTNIENLFTGVTANDVIAFDFDPNAETMTFAIRGVPALIIVDTVNYEFLTVIPIPDPVCFEMEDMALDWVNGAAWIALPQSQQIARVSEFGAVEYFNTAIPYSRLTYEPAGGRVYAATCGSRTIDVLTQDGPNNLVSGGRIDLAQINPTLQSTGVSALSWDATAQSLSIFTTGHGLVHARPNLNKGMLPTGSTTGPDSILKNTLNWELSEPVAALTRGKSLVALALDPSDNSLYALDTGGAPAVLEMTETGDPREVYNLDSRLQGALNFSPSAVAIDDARNEIIVADSNQARFLVINRNTNSSNIITWPMVTNNAMGRVSGISVSPEGLYIIRARSGLFSANKDGSGLMTLTPMQATDAGDIGFANSGAIYSLAPESRRLDQMLYTGANSPIGGSTVVAFLDTLTLPAHRLAGVAVDEQSRSGRIFICSPDEKTIFVLKSTVPANVQNWDLY